jgi:hypothetical protein
MAEPNAWQHVCTKVLLEVLKLPEHQRKLAWQEGRAKLALLSKRYVKEPSQRRIIVADANLTNAKIAELDFSHCYLARPNFRGADLQNCDFSFAIFRGGSLIDANAGKANFESADLEGTRVERLQYNNDTKLNFSRFRPAGAVSTQLDDRVAQQSRVASGKNEPFVRQALNWLTNYGFGIGRILLLSGVVVLLFAAIYYLLDRSHFAVGAGPVTVSALNFWDFLLLSIELFLIGSPWVFGVSTLSHSLTVAENLIGLLALGILVAMVIRQVLRSPS